MRIYYQRVGGFAGMRLSTTLEDQNLEEEEIHALQAEIEQAGFFNLPARLISPAGGLDRFEYHITVEWDQQQHSITVGEAAMPDSLRPLVEHLDQLRRAQR